MSESIEELQLKADADNPEALYKLAIKMLSGDDIEKDAQKAHKYLVFAVQLGNVAACLTLGDLYLSDGYIEKAVETFKRGYMSGNAECGVRYAALMLKDDEAAALDILMEGAHGGDRKAAEALVNFFTEAGNKKEAEFWKKKIKK